MYQAMCVFWSSPLARAAERRAEQAAGRVLAGRVVRPPLAGIDEALVDGVEDFIGIDDGAARHDLDLETAGRHLVDVGRNWFSRTWCGVPAGWRSAAST